MSSRTIQEHCLGNGDPKVAKVWFVGPEAAGDPLYLRYFNEAWLAMGAEETCNVKELHLKTAELLDPGDKQISLFTRLFDEQNCRIQRTWRDLIRLYLAFDGFQSEDDVEAIRDLLKSWVPARDSGYRFAVKL